MYLVILTCITNIPRINLQYSYTNPFKYNTFKHDMSTDLFLCANKTYNPRRRSK